MAGVVIASIFLAVVYVTGSMGIGLTLIGLPVLVWFTAALFASYRADRRFSKNVR